MTFSIFLLLLNWLAQEQKVPTIQFDVQPKSVQLASAALLSWHVANATAIYIFPIGMVEVSGTREITPNQTTSYVLFAEGPGGIDHAEITISVTGIKNLPGGFKAQNVFEPQLTSKIRVPSWPHLANHIQSVLQDSMGYYCRLVQSVEGLWVFDTRLSNLARKNERQVAGRRLAYRIEIPEAQTDSGEFSYEVSTYLEYQPKILQKWLPEWDSPIHREQAERLVSTIGKEVVSIPHIERKNIGK